MFLKFDLVVDLELGHSIVLLYFINFISVSHFQAKDQMTVSGALVNQADLQIQGTAEQTSGFFRSLLNFLRSLVERMAAGRVFQMCRA